jgi:sugar O-acyltransferase (sialic acid O-acetyltransferase NeuD family)
MNQRTKIVVVGGGGHAKVLISILRKLGTFDLVGYTDVEDRGTIFGVPFLGTDDILKELRSQHASLSGFIGLGAVRVTDKRKQLWNRLIREGFDLPAVVSADAVVNEDVSIGEGTVVLDGAVINSGSRIGRNCVINTNCTVEHDCEIADHAHVASGATLGGGVKVGENSMVGAGATVIQCVSICPDCMVGAGAVVIKDISEPGVYVGNPARKLR